RTRWSPSYASYASNFLTCTRAKSDCCLVGVVDEHAKQSSNVLLMEEPRRQRCRRCCSLRRAAACATKPVTCFGNRGVLASQVLTEFFYLRLVTGFGLRQELLIKLLDLRDLFRNEGI